MFTQLLLNGLCAGCVYSLSALGFGLVYNSTRTFHLAHGAIFGLAASTAYVLAINLRVPLFFAIPGALVVVVVTGMAAEWCVYHPLARRSASPAVMMISSIGLYILLANAIELAAGHGAKVFHSGAEETVTFLGLVLTVVQVAQVAVALLGALGFWLLLAYTRFGQMTRALADNSFLLGTLGVDEQTLRLTVFGIGSFMAGVAAILSALDVGVDLDTGLNVTLASAVACIVGGVGRFLAPVAGALLLGVLQNVVIYFTSSQWQPAVTFSVLIVFLLFRPQGIFGTVKRTEES